MMVLPVHAEDECEEGFLTQYLNSAISNGMQSTNPAPAEEKMKYGSKVTDYVSAPVFGGYIVGKYSYTDKENASVSNSFETRLVRAYVSGFILRDFKYRIQVELRNTPAMRDYTLEWLRYKEFQVKVGQFKRCFTLDNPSNPWDIGFGGYSQMAMRMCAFSAEDPSGEAAQNGRDQGLQFSGDLFPVGKDKHRLIHYKAAVYNGTGQNAKENNDKKDWIGQFQIQPLKDFTVALFGWTGSYKLGNVEVSRNRWALSSQYLYKDWFFRAEYAHHTGHNAGMYKAGKFTDAGKADGWYASLGIPMTPWLKTFVKYDAYRKDALWATSRSLYSICPNFQLHKNLKFQLQYNFVDDRSNTADRYYSELWVETYVRF